MSEFDTSKVRLFIESAQSAGLVCHTLKKTGKFLIELRANEQPVGTIEFYRPDEARFGQVPAESRDNIRHLWTSAANACSVRDRTAEEFRYYLRIYEPYRHEGVEFSAIADFVIRLYEAEGMQPPVREDLIVDLAAVEKAYERLQKEMQG